MIQLNQNIRIQVTLYQVKGWFLGKVGCETHCEVLPLDRPDSSPLSPTCNQNDREKKTKMNIIALNPSREL
jgi:hypothetical protein